MKFRSYNNEIKTATVQFMDVFSNIQIDRRDNDDNIQQVIDIPCVLGNRSRVLKSLENKNKTLRLPLISIQMQGFNRDASRAHDLNSGLTLQFSDLEYNAGLNAPVPININFEVSVVSKNISDNDQILTNFLAMCNPDFYVVWGNPKRPGEFLKSHVIWDGNCNRIYSNDISPTDPERTTSICNFIYKTWIFPGLINAAQEDGPLIHKINFDTTLLPTVGNEGYALDKWYQVPTSMTFSDYLGNILCGYIKNENGRDNYDFLPTSGYLSGTNWGVSGYWNSLDPSLASGLLSGANVGLSGENLYYVRSNSGDLLFYLASNSGALLTPGLTMQSYLSTFGQ